MKKRILILGNSSLVVFGMRGELIQRLRQENCEIIVSFPENMIDNEENPSEEYGCTYIPVSIDRRGTNILRDTGLLCNYLRLIRRVKPHAVLTYTVKCSIYGGIACRLLKVPCLVNITGLGKGLAEGGMKQKLLIALYKIAVGSAHCVFFQNRSDRQFFADRNIRCRRSHLLPGSGVNLEKYQPLPYPEDGRTVFLYVGRVMAAKGIDAFLEAAEIIRRDCPRAEFHVCGFLEDDYRQRMEQAQKNGSIVYHGQVNNVLPFVEASHCVVLPTFHPEGVPNVLLEAAACARPILTTNRPGCADVLDEGVNGFFVREKDAGDLVRQMRRFMALPWADRRDMGLKGRAKVEKDFDRQIVVQAYLEQLNNL